jgi:hypothetical protein
VSWVFNYLTKKLFYVALGVTIAVILLTDWLLALASI